MIFGYYKTDRVITGIKNEIMEEVIQTGIKKADHVMPSSQTTVYSLIDYSFSLALFCLITLLPSFHNGNGIFGTIINLALVTLTPTCIAVGIVCLA